MSKTSYKNINDLLNNITVQLKKLQNGALELNDIDALVDETSDLNERLIILRYKAYQAYGKPFVQTEEREQKEQKPKASHVEKPREVKAEGISPIESKPQPITAPEISFDFTAVTETPKIIEQPLFDFAPEEKKIDLPVVNNDEIKATPVKTDEISEPSLNQLLKTKEDVSLIDKLGKNAIQDIKTHVSIAQKFEFISFLFKGENATYEEAINFLNNCESSAKAIAKIDEYATQFNWDKEEKSTLKFMELIERRYL